MLAEFKSNMRLGFHSRFPVSELSIVASVLDSRLKDLRSVNAYLASSDVKDKAELLLKYMEKHRSAAREPNERIIVGEDPSSSRSQAKNPRFSLESLVERHSEANVGVSAKSVAEVHAYLSTPASSVTNDILEFWRLNGKLAQLDAGCSGYEYASQATF